MSIHKLEIELRQNKEKLAKAEKELEKLNNDQFKKNKADNDPFDVYKPVQISRRDYFAAMAMQSYIRKYGDKIDIIKDSIFLADKIIAELDKPRL